MLLRVFASVRIGCTPVWLLRPVAVCVMSDSEMTIATKCDQIFFVQLFLNMLADTFDVMHL